MKFAYSIPYCLISIKQRPPIEAIPVQLIVIFDSPLIAGPRRESPAHLTLSLCPPHPSPQQFLPLSPELFNLCQYGSNPVGAGGRKGESLNIRLFFRQFLCPPTFAIVHVGVTPPSVCHPPLSGISLKMLSGIPVSWLLSSGPAIGGILLGLLCGGPMRSVRGAMVGEPSQQNPYDSKLASQVASCPECQLK